MNEPRTVDITPAWAGLVPIFVAMLQDPETPPETVRNIRDQLLALARFADAHNDRIRAAKEGRA